MNISSAANGQGVNGDSTKSRHEPSEHHSQQYPSGLSYGPKPPEIDFCSVFVKDVPKFEMFFNIVIYFLQAITVLP